MTETNYPPGCSQRDHDEAFKGEEDRSCEECGSEPCSCHLCQQCGDEVPLHNGLCIACDPPHSPDCRCEDCYRGPDRWEETVSYEAEVWP